jgi:type II secretory pathway component GspD/PulD (secretin)
MEEERVSNATSRRRSRSFLLHAARVALALATLAVAPAFAEDPPAPAPAPAQPTPAPEPPPEEPPRPALTFHNEGLIEKADGTVVYFYRTNFAAPDALIQAVNTMGFQGLVTGLKSYPAQNQVVVEGDPDAVEMLLDALAYFDVAEPQVFIEAKVVEITYESNFEYGLDYLMDRDAVGPDTIFRGFSGVLNPPSLLLSGYPPNFPFQGAQLLFGLVGENAAKYGLSEAGFQALLVNGKAEVLSKPSIIATQNKEAVVTTQEQTPILTLTRAQRNFEEVTSTSVTTGVELKVTPEHIGDRFLRLKIAPKVNGTAGLASIRPGGTFAPITTLRSATTTVTLADGETLVIGGLYTNNHTTEKAKTPLLSDIPLLGNIFTRTKETKQKTELVFLLTPHIVRKTQDLKIVIPPAELERLEEREEKGGEKECRCGPKITWGAEFDD